MNVEDTEIHAIFEDIDNILAQMPREQRLKHFERQIKPKDIDFVRKVGDVYYVVRSHFDREKREDMRSKVQRLVLSDGQENTTALKR